MFMRLYGHIFQDEVINLMEAAINTFSINSKPVNKVPHGRAAFDLPILYRRKNALAFYFAEN